jgi:hypothetical protein
MYPTILLIETQEFRQVAGRKLLRAFDLQQVLVVVVLRIVRHVGRSREYGRIVPLGVDDDELVMHDDGWDLDCPAARRRKPSARRGTRGKSALVKFSAPTTSFLSRER